MQTAISPLSNPGLASFDLTAYRGVQNLNFYEEDRLLQRIIHKYGSAYEREHLQAVEKNLQKYGELAGGILDRLVKASHKEGKWGQVIQYDRVGKRIDEVDYCFEQKEVRRINYEYGIVNLDFHPEWRYPFTELHRMALAYLSNTNGEAGINCPLGMTDGMIRVLQALGTPEQKEKYLRLVADPQSKSHFMAGQYVTERVGGSNVAENRTIACKAKEKGKWILKGEKWFCSNPGDLWVTTARLEDSNIIGMFLVPRIKSNGELNGCRILRKKDIIGSKGKLTVETLYEDLEAEELGRPSHGLANLIRYVIQTSRRHVALSAVGISRRAFMEARAYSSSRTAYKKSISAFPSVQRSLAEMQVRHSSLLWCVFRNVELYDRKEKLSMLFTPLLKYIASVHSTWITHAAILLHGGNGIIDDFSCLPRLHNDSIINETWEGTHQIIAEHAWKSFVSLKIQKDYFAFLENNIDGCQKKQELGYALHVLEKEKQVLKEALDADQLWLQRVRLQLCDTIYHCMALSEWLSEAKSNSDAVGRNFALALAELIESGANGLILKQGIFSDSAQLDELIAY